MALQRIHVFQLEPPQAMLPAQPVLTCILIHAELGGAGSDRALAATANHEVDLEESDLARRGCPA